MSEPQLATAAGRLLAPPPILRETADIRHAVRRLRWFTKSFRSQIEVRPDVAFTVRERQLTDCFVEWVDAFAVQKRLAAGREPDFVRFASGLMLQALIRHDPVQVVALPEAADIDDPAYFWPQGFAYLTYCLNVRAAVLRQEFGQAMPAPASLQDIRAWWSFRENTAADAALAIAFLDYFAGATPNWTAPDLFSAVITGRAGPACLPRRLLPSG